MIHLGLLKIILFGPRSSVFRFNVCFAEESTLLLSLYQSRCGPVKNLWQKSWLGHAREAESCFFWEVLQDRTEVQHMTCVLHYKPCIHTAFKGLLKCFKLNICEYSIGSEASRRGKQGVTCQLEVLSYTVGPSALPLFPSTPSRVIPPLQFADPLPKTSDLFSDWIRCLLAL